MRHRQIPVFFSIAVVICFAAIVIYACQNKRPAKTMNEKELIPEPDSSYRLLTIANLEQVESSRKVIAWFFETPQIFEFSLKTEQAKQNFSLLKDAKEKQLPVNVTYTSSSGKNIITLILPATPVQLNEYNKEKNQRAEPVRMPPPPDK